MKVSLQVLVLYFDIFAHSCYRHPQLIPQKLKYDDQPFHS